MTKEKEVWPIHIAAAAENDLQDILHWTVTQFGTTHARIYAETLTSAISSLTDGPKVLGVQARDDIAQGLFTLHVARMGHKGRHFVIFRIGQDHEKQLIDVLRILHDSMDIPRHLLPKENDD
ncbi:MAG: type II toxin-antitoxin system RelE/ParE family toxin [Steroidobacter sp.]